ncbi:hypothetical protein JG688_00002903 [Phytophthora aleatoria]|uniref:Uncharacterized protein n=1 Tax=Phytophthora aleatoria TaxID=2496075 RepID=A0A8J5IUV5_9STRA|nr:hypothetical protein JG688_00002903 [Phytophthora aleatoria]
MAREYEAAGKSYKAARTTVTTLNERHRQLQIAQEESFERERHDRNFTSNFAETRLATCGVPTLNSMSVRIERQRELAKAKAKDSSPSKPTNKKLREGAHREHLNMQIRAADDEGADEPTEDENEAARKQWRVEVDPISNDTVYFHLQSKRVTRAKPKCFQVRIPKLQLPGNQVEKQDKRALLERYPDGWEIILPKEEVTRRELDEKRLQEAQDALLPQIRAFLETPEGEKRFQREVGTAKDAEEKLEKKMQRAAEKAAKSGKEISVKKAETLGELKARIAKREKLEFAEARVCEDNEELERGKARLGQGHAAFRHEVEQILLEKVAATVRQHLVRQQRDKAIAMGWRQEAERAADDLDDISSDDDDKPHESEDSDL